LIIAAVAAVLFAVMCVYLWTVVNHLRQAAVAPPVLGPISSTVALNESRALSYNESSEMAVYALLSYDLKNTTNATATLDAYTRNPIEKIYLVNVSSYCLSCFGSNALRTDLSFYLGEYGLLNASGFAYVDMANVSKIPANSIVVIPSGILPLPLANATGAGIFRMLDEGDTVIYAGTDFSRAIRQDGVIILASNATRARLTLYNLSSVPFANDSKAKPNAENLSFRGPAFQFAYGSDYGNATYINSRNGTVIAFSNYPVSGWGNASSMASDLAKAIDARFWIPDIGHGFVSFGTSNSASGSLGVLANVTKSTNSSITGPERVNSSYSLVTFVSRNPKGSSETQLSFRNVYAWNGIVNAPSTIGEGQVASITVSANNKTSPTVQLHVDVYDENMTHLVKSIRIGTGSVPSYSLEEVTPTFSMPSGYYLLALKGFYNNYYAESFFYLANATINETSSDFKNGTFAFSVFSNGLPVSNATYTVSMDGAYVSNGTMSNGTLLYRLPHGTVVGYGNHVFKIEIFGNGYTLYAPYTQTFFYVPAIDIEFAIAIIVVVLLNLILKPPTRDEYYVDVPEFPPLKKEKVGVPAASVLGVFDKINYYYHWKYMPLNVEEVRLGINNNIRINNLPVSVTTQNTDAVLASLAAKGDLVSTLNYYAPKAWIDASQHDVEYLLIFRKLRDYCVVHAILFTDIDMEQAVDLTVTKEGKQSGVFIYSTGSRPKPVTLSADSRSFLVFLDETRKQEFINALYASYGDEAETLKLGIDYNYLVLIDCDHLEQLTL
jgi:hypothetical protein